MIRRWFVCTAVLGCIALLWAQAVEAQCSPNPCYTANPPTVTRLTPAQYAAKGGVTATVSFTVTDGTGGVPSHYVTITPGTHGTFTRSSNNGVSAQTYWLHNSDPTHLWPTSTDLSGNDTWNSNGLTAGDIWTYVFNITDAYGNTTQDRVPIMIGGGAAGTIISQDGIPSNTILRFHASGGGGSMLNDFTECQAGQIHQCINATHTPFTTLTVKNATSGETQFHSKHVSGNTASANQTVNFSDDMFFSALPEDVFEYTEGDEVDCSVYGPIGVAPVHMDIRFERAITESYISSILNSNGMHPEHIYCIIAATPPDFPGPDEALPGTPSGQVVNIAFMYREWPAGTQEAGTPWNLVFPDIQEVGIGYYVKTTMEPDPSGCTMWDNGFRHLPLPTPLDPQPQ